jgi:hypothetical protein
MKTRSGVERNMMDGTRGDEVDASKLVVLRQEDERKLKGKKPRNVLTARK